MALIHKCDECSKQIESERFLIIKGYVRTLDEIKELLKAKGIGVNESSIDRMQLASKIVDILDVCKGCYDKFKKVNFK